MKAITEFPVHILTKGIAAKTALATEGKTEEEVATSIGETFKYEGDKLKHFINALGVAETNAEKLSRVRVLSLAEGESVPAKSTIVDEVHYVPDFIQPPGKPITVKVDAKAAGKGKEKAKGPKTSPWGLSPEEIAAKKEASLRAAKSK
jgi:hypothetical protein